MGYTMDKVAQTYWLQEKMKAGEIKFPSMPSKDICLILDFHLNQFLGTKDHHHIFGKLKDKELHSGLLIWTP